MTNYIVRKEHGDSCKKVGIAKSLTDARVMAMNSLKGQNTFKLCTISTENEKYVGSVIKRGRAEYDAWLVLPVGDSWERYVPAKCEFAWDSYNSSDCRELCADGNLGGYLLGVELYHYE